MQCYVCKGLMLIAIGQPIAAFDTWVFGETAAGYQVAPAEVFMHPACLETLNKRG